jgi:hypothetical protein
MTARILGRVLLIVVLMASSAYFLVYLRRWEWDRAQEAGLVFVAALIALVASVLLRRLQAIDARIEELQHRPAPPSPPAALEAIRDSAPPPPDRFAWLRESQSRTNVYIFMLLGAGVLLSGLATVVERVGGATAKPVLEHRLALRLQPLALPAGGLLGPSVPVAVASRRRGVVGRTLALAVAALLLVGAAKALGDATQTRPDSSTEGMTTSLILSISHKESGRSAEETTEALWSACEATLRRDLDAWLLPLSGGQTRLAIVPGLGKHARAKFEGCLQDHKIERVLAHVESSTTADTVEADFQGERLH